MKVLILPLLTVAMLAGTPAVAQAPLDSYVTVVRGDSVAFYYGLDYKMVQPACATIRRLVRLDKDGSFHGPFRDVRRGDTLVASGRYQHGQKEGLFTLYHLNGKQAARGFFQQNQRTGDWDYWYPSGQKRQTLRFNQSDQATVVAYWDTAGIQRVQDGTGEWFRPDISTAVSGPVVKGHPTGEWRRTDTASGKLLATETFDDAGRFRQGRWRGSLIPGAAPVYQDQTRMSIAEPVVLANAESYALSPPCSPAIAPRLREGGSAANGNYVAAAYKNGSNAYGEMLWLRIRSMLNQPQSQNASLANYHGGLRFAVNLDATGGWQTEIYKAEGVNLEAARQILQIMRNLPRWNPALENGQTTASSVIIEYSAIAPTYRISVLPQRGLVDTGFGTQSAP